MENDLDKVVVVGDLRIDWLEVATPPVEPDPSASTDVRNWQTYPGIHRLALPGGAALLARFVEAATNRTVVAPELGDLKNVCPEQVIHREVGVGLFPRSSAEKTAENAVYRVKEIKGFAGPVGGAAPSLGGRSEDTDVAMLVVDDAGNGYCRDKDTWPASLDEAQPIVVYKMARPPTPSPLWNKLRQDHADRLVVVIGAEDLRRSGVGISHRLSWERTAQEFVWQMASNPALVSLNNCAHVVVRFGVDGAMLYSRRAAGGRARLFFDPLLDEDGFQDQHPGYMPGVSSVLTAAIAARVLDHGLEEIGPGICEGMLGARRMCSLGFGTDPENLDYPSGRVFAKAPEAEAAIAQVTVPSPAPGDSVDKTYWCILDELADVGLEGVAADYIVRGKNHVLDNVPVGQFGKLKTVDRAEIESFRGIQNLIREYLAAPKAKRPLNMAVFGTPGSGKSFGVSQVAACVAPDDIARLDFNLSQFNSLGDLAAAFHKVRDVVLEGKIPLVFFDEFDSNFHGKLGWLKYFLMPMQDGTFRENEALHPIGKSIFVFAGGTCSTLGDFAGERCRASDIREACLAETGQSTGVARTHTQEEFRAAKGPDFVSRLRGYVNIKGPDPVDENDRVHVVRRALLLRGILEGKASWILDRKGNLRIDPGVVRAFIKVPQYKHGTRSISAIVEMSTLAGRDSFSQTALPPSRQLELHVDEDLFSRLVVRDVLLGGARELLARAIHERFRKEHKETKAEDDLAMRPWDDLQEDLKESNRRQADHIPTKLKAIGCEYSPVVDERVALIEFTEDEIEGMAEMEHDGWNSERLLQDWSLGPRDHANKTSPYLVAWEELPDEIRDYDRNAVRAIPALLARCNFTIYRLRRPDPC